ILRWRRQRVEAPGRGFLTRRKVASLPSGFGLRTECRESCVCDSVAHAYHQFVVVGEINHGENCRAEHFAALAEVVQVGARIGARGWTRTFLVKRARVVGVARVLEGDRPE